MKSFDIADCLMWGDDLRCCYAVMSAVDVLSRLFLLWMNVQLCLVIHLL